MVQWQLVTILVGDCCESPIWMSTECTHRSRGRISWDGWLDCLQLKLKHCNQFAKCHHKNCMIQSVSICSLVSLLFGSFYRCQCQNIVHVDQILNKNRNRGRHRHNFCFFCVALGAQVYYKSFVLVTHERILNNVPTNIDTNVDLSGTIFEDRGYIILYKNKQQQQKKKHKNRHNTWFRWA